LAGNRSVEEIGRDSLKHETELYETGQQKPR
jgi:hypothetical protein